MKREVGMRVTKKRRAREKDCLENGNLRELSWAWRKEGRGQGSWEAAEEPGLSVKQPERVEGGCRRAQAALGSGLAGLQEAIQPRKLVPSEACHHGDCRACPPPRFSLFPL